MTARLPLFVVRDFVTREGSPFTAPQILVALCVADLMTEEAGAWPSVRFISAWTRLGLRTVKRTLRVLCAEGGPFEVVHGGARAGARYASNTYRLREGCHSGTPNEVGQTDTPQGVPERPQGPQWHLRGATAAPALSKTLPSYRTVHASLRSASKQKTTKGGWPARLAEEWERILGGVLSPGRTGKALEALVARHGIDVVASAWARYLEHAVTLSRDERRFISPSAFATRFGDWNGGPPKSKAPEEPPGPVFSGPRSRPA